MNTRTAAVALGVATFGGIVILFGAAIFRTVIFSIWAGALGAYVSAPPPANINALWSSVAAIVWSALVLAVLFIGLIQMVRYRRSGPYLVAAGSAIALICLLPTWIFWKMDWGWAFLFGIPALTMVFALLPSTRRVTEDYSLETGA